MLNFPNPYTRIGHRIQSIKKHVPECFQPFHEISCHKFFPVDHATRCLQRDDDGLPLLVSKSIAGHHTAQQTPPDSVSTVFPCHDLFEDHCVSDDYNAIQVSRRNGFGIRFQSSAVDKNATGSLPGRPDVWRRDTDVLLFRMGHIENRPQALHDPDLVRICRKIFFLFHHDATGLGAVNRDPERHVVRVRPCRDGFLLQNDLATEHEPHNSRTCRTVRQHR